MTESKCKKQMKKDPASLKGFAGQANDRQENADGKKT